MRRVASWTAMVLVFLIAGAIVNLAVAWGFAIVPGKGLAKNWTVPKGHYVGSVTSSGDFSHIRHEWGRVETMHNRSFIASTVVVLQRYDGSRSIRPRFLQHELDNQTVIAPHAESIVPRWSRIRDHENVMCDYITQSGALSGSIEIQEIAVGWPLVSCLSREVTRHVANRTPIAGSTMAAPATVRTIEVLEPATAIVLPAGWLPPGWRTELPWLPMWTGLIVNSATYALAFWILLVGFSKLRRFLRRRHGCCAVCGYDLRGSPSGDCPECGPPEATRTQPAGITAADSGAV